jgi:hypothetical protein
MDYNQLHFAVGKTGCSSPLRTSLKTADPGFEPISNGWSLAGHCFNTEEKMVRTPKKARPKPCFCGSGKLWSRQYDARGIFLT